ncbi:hypothetical protein RBB50_000391 [Rhinocladiella similis]
MSLASMLWSRAHRRHRIRAITTVINKLQLFSTQIMNSKAATEGGTSTTAAHTIKSILLQGLLNNQSWPSSNESILFHRRPTRHLRLNGPNLCCSSASSTIRTANTPLPNTTTMMGVTTNANDNVDNGDNGNDIITSDRSQAIYRWI